MISRCVPAAALAALLSCASAAPAVAQGGVLVSQMAQATPTPPPLTEQPDGLGEEPQPVPEPTAEPTTAPDPEATPGPELPDTGAEPALLAVAGIGLLAAGVGLRRSVDADLGS